MKKLLLSFCLAFTALTLSANPVDYQTARTIAENFAIAQRVPAPDVISLVPEQMFTQLYVFGFRGQKGFVIISADDRAIPILGYSLTTEFQSENMPEHISAWLRDYENQINWLIDNHVEPSAEIQNRWSELLNPTNPNAPMAEIIVDPLVQTAWNQGEYYNDLCPLYSGKHAATGCAATATAQIMRYWYLPTSGHGSYSYEWKGETISANFDTTTYEWNNMPDSLNQSSTKAQVKAVATLMYHVGVSMNMHYGLENDGGSGASTCATSHNDPSAEWALMNFFNYKNTLHRVCSWTMSDAQWKNTLKNELDNARPVIYTATNGAGGHAFICDGYDSQDYFHLNWGWGGRDNGFFAIGAFNTTYVGNFKYRNAAIIGIEPNRNSIPSQMVVTTAVNDPTLGSVTGAGTYNQYDTVKITAHANEGYRFDHWNDGSPANPRYIPATSASYNLTAYFVPISADTIGYCLDEYFDVRPANDTSKWGIRYPASILRSGRVVDYVKFYCVSEGQYKLVIYQGDSAAMTQVYSETFNLHLTKKWVDLPLATPYAIDTTRSIWITLEHYGSDEVMTVSDYFSGNQCGMMQYKNSAWVSLNDTSYFAWMIRGILSDPASISTRYEVNGVASPDSCGTVSPQYARIIDGTELQFVANPAENSKLICWSDSLTGSKRTVTPTSDTTLTAIFEALRPDTTTYCVDDNCITNMGAKGFSWAIKVKAGVYSQLDSIRSVMLYDCDSSDIKLAIYAGDSVTGNPLHTQSYTLTKSGQWVTLPLSTPVECPANEDLWVTFVVMSDSRPVAASRYSYNTNSCLFVSDDQSWKSLASVSSLYEMTWMIKVVTNHNDAPTAVDNVSESDVTLAPNPVHAGETAYIYGDWSDAELDGMLLEVLTIDGRTITRTTPQTFPIAINGITAPGTYIIKITTGTGTSHIRKLTVH